MTAIMAKGINVELEHFQINDFAASIPKGQLTAIVGPNGSGKSTLLKTLSRLLVPDSGEIIVDGKNLADYKNGDLARKLSMLPQSRDLTSDLTVSELVAYGRSPHKRLLGNSSSKQSDAEHIDWAMQVTGVKRYASRLVNTLSGGELQRARIAMVLAQRTDLILLDEPTTYLDIAHQLDLMTLLRDINREYGLTIVMVLHDLQQAAAYSDYMIAMRDGFLTHAGTPQELLTSELLSQVYGIEATVQFDGHYPVIIPHSQHRRNNMIIVTNTSKITKGEAHKLIERFDRIGQVEAMEGFLGLEVMLTDKTKDYDEVTVSTRWRSKEDFQAWTRSDAFRESHSHRKIPEYILSNTIATYEVKIVREPIAKVAASTEEEAI